MPEHVSADSCCANLVQASLLMYMLHVQVLSIDGRSTDGWDGDHAAKFLRGRSGSSVTVRFARRSLQIPGVAGRPELPPRVEFQQVCSWCACACASGPFIICRAATAHSSTSLLSCMLLVCQRPIVTNAPVNANTVLSQASCCMLPLNCLQSCSPAGSIRAPCSRP